MVTVAQCSRRIRVAKRMAAYYGGIGPTLSLVHTLKTNSKSTL